MLSPFSFSRHDHRASAARTAFTLIELLVAMAVGTIMIVFLLQVFNASIKAWRQGEDQTETYREARAAMQMMVRDLSQTIQPMTPSVYASPTPVPGSTPAVIAPALVIDRYSNDTPANGDEINEEVYCLTTIPNNGASNLCAVGYFCAWRPGFDNSAHAPHAYSLMRQYLGSGAPANPTAIPGLYDRFKAASSAQLPPPNPQVPLTFAEVFERETPPLTSITPKAVATELASYIWDLQIRTPATLQSTSDIHADASNMYKQASNQRVIPSYVEVRFKALSESAARQLEANSGVGRTTWNDSNSTSNSIYQHIILPGTRQFSARVPIYSGSSTATPTP